MCSLRIVVSNSSYQGPFIRYSPVISDGLKLWMFPGGLGFETTKNHASGGEDATVVGNPVIENGFAECRGGAKYFETNVPDSSEMTVVAVMRGHKEQSTGNQDTGNAGGNLKVDLGSREGFRLGYHIQEGNYNPLAFYVGQGASFDQVTILHPGPTNPTDWSMVSASISNSSGAFLRDWTAGVENSKSSLTSFSSGNTPITVGGLSENFAGYCDVAFFAMYDRVLSYGEIEEIYDQVSGYLSLRAGINV